MRRLLFTTAIALVSTASQAQNPPPANLELTTEQVDRMVDSAGRLVAEGQVWARIKVSLDALYRDLRGKGETSRQAIHNLRRISLPGVDIGQFGQRGQTVRQDLELLAQVARRKDGLSESAATAATSLALQELLQTLVAVEKPNRIHLAVSGQDGVAKTRRSESLHDGGRPRTIVEFTERVGSSSAQECTVDTLGLTEEVYFTVTCRARGKDTYPMAIAKSQCSINDDRLRSLRLVLQSTDAEPAHEVLVWCSFEPR